MRSPEDFPADILKAAREVVADPTANIYTCIARALMERDRAATERAAKVADTWRETSEKLTNTDNDEQRLHHLIASDMAQDIAAAIRSQP
jgi:hypothetical protein